MIAKPFDLLFVCGSVKHNSVSIGLLLTLSANQERYHRPISSPRADATCLFIASFVQRSKRTHHLINPKGKRPENRVIGHAWLQNRVVGHALSV